MHFAAGKVPDQPGVNGTKEQFSLFGALPGAFHMIQDPFDLGP